MYPNQAKKQNSFSDPYLSLPISILSCSPFFHSGLADSQVLCTFSSPPSLASPATIWLTPAQPPWAVLTLATGDLWLAIKSSGSFFF